MAGRFSRLAKSILMGLGALYLAETFGVADSITDKYHALRSMILEKKGTAEIYFRDSDGISAIIIENDSCNSEGLTKIPGIASMIDGNDALVEIPDLKPGIYSFQAYIFDLRGNVRIESFQYNIKNPNGGIEGETGECEVTDSNRIEL